MSNTATYKLIISYEGTRYLGWQDNHKGLTIEGVLSSALRKILRQEICLNAASRTDRGVHAYGQVVHFHADVNIALDNFKYRLNQLLPKDLRVLSLQRAKKDFHATLHSKGKTYLYYVDTSDIQYPHFRKTMWHIYKPLNLSAMQKASKYFLGKQDFCSFSNRKEKNSIREIKEVQMHKNQNHCIIIQISGDSFLYKMVRNLVGTLVYVGLGKILPEKIPEIINTKDRRYAGPTAPAYGLFLQTVHYK